MKALATLAGLTLLATSANAALINLEITGGYHTSYQVASSQTGGVMTPTTVYGDGANSGATPGNICLDGNPLGTTPVTCAGASRAFVNATNPGFPAGTYANGNNGNYWGVGWPGSNPTGLPNTLSPAFLAAIQTPVAQYTGTLTYDTNTGQITAGVIQWTGVYGVEVSVPVSPTSGNVGGSWFSWAWANGNINLATGLKTTGTTGTSPNAVCFLGAAGNIVVGNLLCGGANPAANYSFHQANIGYQALYTPLGDGEGLLTLSANRYTLLGQGNNLYEQWRVQVVPVPAAVWLFGSALGLFGVLRRRQASA